MSEKCAGAEGCEEPVVWRGLCRLHYERERHPGRIPYVLRSDNLRRVNLDSVSVNWLVAVLEKLPPYRIWKQETSEQS